MKRNYNVYIRLSKNEKDKLKSEAEKVGLSLMSYIRFIVLSGRLKEQS